VISGVAPQGLDLAWSYSLAAVCLLAFLGLLYQLCGTKNRDDHEKKVRRFWYAVLGSDDRVSTSKVQLALWTVALAFALLVIVLPRFHLPAEHTRSALPPPPRLSGGCGGRLEGHHIGPGDKRDQCEDSRQLATKKLREALKEVISDDKDNLDLGDASTSSSTSWLCWPSSSPSSTAPSSFLYCPTRSWD